MRLVDHLYDWLLHGPSPGCDRILTAALSQAEPAWAEHMMQVLLLRGRDASWAGLIGQYDRLAPEIRELLQHPDEHVQGGIALALKSPSRDVRVNALRARLGNHHAERGALPRVAVDGDRAAALPPDPAFTLFVALYQVPMLLTPAILQAMGIRKSAPGDDTRI